MLLTATVYLAFHFYLIFSFVVVLSMIYSCISLPNGKSTSDIKMVYKKIPRVIACMQTVAMSLYISSLLLLTSVQSGLISHSSSLLRSLSTVSLKKVELLKAKKRPQMIAEMRAWIPVKLRKRTKYLILRLPTQVPIQGQWWSCTSTHTLQSRQWNDRGGRKMLQVLHTLSDSISFEVY